MEIDNKLIIGIAAVIIIVVAAAAAYSFNQPSMSVGNNTDNTTTSDVSSISSSSGSSGSSSSSNSSNSSDSSNMQSNDKDSGSVSSSGSGSGTYHKASQFSNGTILGYFTWITCKNCGGDGKVASKVWIPYPSPGHYAYSPNSKTCDLCDGTGKVRKWVAT